MVNKILLIAILVLTVSCSGGTLHCIRGVVYTCNNNFCTTSGISSSCVTLNDIDSDIGDTNRILSEISSLREDIYYSCNEYGKKQQKESMDAYIKINKGN